MTNKLSRKPVGRTRTDQAQSHMATTGCGTPAVPLHL